MNETKTTHTPGPWTPEKYTIWSGQRYVAGTQTGIPEDEQRANASLIASSPEMLSALKAVTERLASATSMLNSLGYPVYYAEATPHIDAARAAIQKATGDGA